VTPYLSADRAGNSTSGGVGDDLVYRDPWGVPYFITLDLNSDGKTRDEFYRFDAVSADPSDPTKGINGLVKTGPALNTFAVPSDVAIWSAGPDKQIDTGNKANLGANKDNITSWK